MKKMSYLGFSLLLMLSLALPGLAQQAKNKAEYDAYMLFYNEQNPQRKGEAAEKFLADPAYKDSEFKLPAVQGAIIAFRNAQNWAKVMEMADKLTTFLPTVDNNLKTFAYENAMVAGQQAGIFEKIVEFGDKVLEINPNNLNAQITLSSMLPERLPADEAAKKTALDRALDLASKAQAQVPQIFAQKPAQFTDEQWNRERANLDGQLNATLGLIHLNRAEYALSAEKYETALKTNPKDGISHYRIGLAYQYQASDATKLVLAAITTENEAKAARAEEAVVNDLVAKREGLETDARAKRDKAIDSFARAVAIGGVVAQPARDQLERLYKAKNNDVLDGLDQLINEKKTELGV
jgi:tetratricopeptide (TPR) repeat protein